MKKVFSLCIVVITLTCVITGCAHEIHGTKFQWEDGFAWTKTNDGKSVAIIGYMGTNTNLQIPSQIKGLPVTNIVNIWTIGKDYLGNFCYENDQQKFTNIIIPNSVTRIGRDAFRSTGLTSITIPNSVTYIGYGAFANNQLTSIIIPDSVTQIEGGNLGTIDYINSGTTNWGAFAFNKLTSVTIGKGLTEIGAVTFTKNELTNINIPDNVKVIGDGAFAYNQLTSVTIPEGITLGKRVFEGNKQLVNAPMTQEEQRQAQQKAEQEKASQAEKARIVELYRQAGNSLGNLKNTSWTFSQRLNNRNVWNERIDFGDGNFNRQSPNFFGNAVTVTGTYRVSGDTVIFFLEGEYSTGTIVGNSLTTNGGVMGNTVTFNRIQ